MSYIIPEIIGPFFIFQGYVVLCCGVLIFVIVLLIMFYALFKYSTSSKPYDRKEEPETYQEREAKRYKEADIDFEQKKKESDVSFMDKVLRRKKTCEDCGSELMYKESYDSYYCPECRTFK